MKLFFPFFVLIIMGCTSSQECHFKEFNLSKLPIEVSDKDYLEIVMGFSYGSEVKKFASDLSRVESNFYYQDSKDKPLMTFLTTQYKTEKVAQEAYEYLKAKWQENTKNEYDVFKSGQNVTWFGNNRLDKECFLKITKNTKELLSK